MLDLIFFYLRENRGAFNALAGALESSGLEGVDILLPESEKCLMDSVAASLKRGRRTAIGLSFFTSQSAYFSRLIRSLRERFHEKAFIMAGGPHPSGAPREVLDMGAHKVVVGEGEREIVRLAAALLEGGPPEAGAARAGRVDLDDYLPFSPKWHMFGSVEITRGCPFGCSYCQTGYLFGSTQRHRSLERVLSAAAKMRSERLRDIRFLSPDAFAYGSGDGRTLNLGALESLLKGTRREMGEDGRVFFGTFPSEVRPEHVTRETLGLTRAYAANKRLVIGAQSGSPRMLEAMRRGHGVQEIYRAVRLAAEYGFDPNVDFIFGLPGETARDLELTLKVIEDLIGIGARIHAHTFMPLPQTPLYGHAGVPLPAAAERSLRKLCSRGQAFGQWERQRPAV